MKSDTDQDISAKLMLEALPIAVIWINNQGVVDWLNTSAKIILGQNWHGSPWEQVMKSCFKEMQSDGLEVATQDGRLLQVLLSTVDKSPGQLISLVDVTPSRTLQSHIAHQQRLSSIGQMTAQLAHQLRTPLASAILLTERLAKQLANKKETDLLSKLNQCHQSIETQIKDLLAYCRGAMLAKEVGRVKDWFCQWQGLANTYIQKTNVELVSEYCLDEQCQINANFEALNGCLFNLLDNALQAQASCIKIKVCPVWDAFVAIEIQDNGCGMSQDLIDKIREPFFTTKAKGTGLGLAVVESIINQHAGTINIDSVPNEGSVVRLIIPLCQQTGKENASYIDS